MIFIPLILIGIGFALFYFSYYTVDKRTSINYSSLKKPAFFPAISTESKDLAVSTEGYNLGRFLFHDGRLVGTDNPDSLKSCSSCHKQAYSFSSPIVTGSDLGMGPGRIQDPDDVSHIKRSVPPLINLIFNDAGYLWNGGFTGTMGDGHKNIVENLVGFCLTSPHCLNSQVERAIQVISQDTMYIKMFATLYGEAPISMDQIAHSISQFIGSIIASQFKLYAYNSGQEVFNKMELEGYKLFHSEKAGCFHCHAGSMMMTNFQFANNAMDSVFTDLLDRRSVTGNTKDHGSYRVPSLINCAFTPPYMHDGRFATLEQVIDHYSEGIVNSPLADPLIKGLPNGGIHLTEYEKASLKAFLLTLSDNSIISDTSLACPGELGRFGIK